MPYGWLPSRSDIVRDENWFGIPLRQEPPLPTRWEEFTFVAERLYEEKKPGHLLDAACGFEPGVHIFPEIAASIGWQVEALDQKEMWSGFPPSDLINRIIGDVQYLPFVEDEFDAVVCISALEHMPEPTQNKALQEFHRVLKPRGLIVLTIDHGNLEGWTKKSEELFDWGKQAGASRSDLQPPVSFFVGRCIK